MNRAGGPQAKSMAKKSKKGKGGKKRKGGLSVMSEDAGPKAVGKTKGRRKGAARKKAYA